MTTRIYARRRQMLGTTIALSAVLGLVGIAPAAAADDLITIKGGQVRGAFNRTASAWAAFAT